MIPDFDFRDFHESRYVAFVDSMRGLKIAPGSSGLDFLVAYFAFPL